MNALKLLEKDHQEVKKLLDQGESASEADAREKLFDSIRKEMEIHEAIEEEIFYPALNERADDASIVLEGYEEHHVVDLIMGELTALAFEDESWPAKFKVMKENIEHHIEEEEGEMWKAAQKAFSGDQLDALGREMEERKKELQQS
jgi:Hemerythrin HHE cation binding domain